MSRHWLAMTSRSTEEASEHLETTVLQRHNEAAATERCQYLHGEHSQRYIICLRKRYSYMHACMYLREWLYEYISAYKHIYVTRSGCIGSI